MVNSCNSITIVPCSIAIGMKLGSYLLSQSLAMFFKLTFLLLYFADIDWSHPYISISLAGFVYDFTF